MTDPPHISDILRQHDAALDRIEKLACELAEMADRAIPPLLRSLYRAHRVVEAARPVLTWVETLPVKHPSQAEMRDRLREALREYDERG